LRADQTRADLRRTARRARRARRAGRTRALERPAEGQLPLIGLGPRHGVLEESELLEVKLAVMIAIRPGELNFQIAKHLFLRDGPGRRYGSCIVLNCHSVASYAAVNDAAFSNAE
jgi:hypothetical protein